MELKLERIQKIANIAKIVCNVLLIMSIVGASIITVSCILFNINFDIDLGGVSIFGLISDNTGMDENLLLATQLQALFECVSAAVIFGFATRYLKNEVNDGTPFTENGSKEVLRLGIITLAAPLAADMLFSIITSIMKAELDYSAEFEIAAGLLLILMSFIFSYGAELENKKSAPDEISNQANEELTNSIEE